MAGLTEDCFQKNPLEFVGDETELRTLYKNGVGGQWRTVRAKRTTHKGSQWTEVAEPNDEIPRDEKGVKREGDLKIRKDQVLVPLKLRPGRYVLSFRWDCERTPQVIEGGQAKGREGVLSVTYFCLSRSGVAVPTSR